MYHMPGASLDQGIQKWATWVPAPGIQEWLKNRPALQGLTVYLEESILNAMGERALSQVGAGQHKEEVAASIWQLVVKSAWSRMRMPLSDPRALLAICVTLSKTFNLSVPPFPNCKMRVMTIMVTTPPVPQDGCCKDSANSHRAFRTVTDMRTAHEELAALVMTERAVTELNLKWKVGISQEDKEREPSRWKPVQANEYKHEKQPGWPGTARQRRVERQEMKMVRTYSRGLVCVIHRNWSLVTQTRGRPSFKQLRASAWHNLAAEWRTARRRQRWGQKD